MKKVKAENFRVVVEPRGLGDFGYVRTSDSFAYPKQKDQEKEYRNRCDDIIEQIKRHVDNIRCVEMLFDSEYICEHCGCIWGEDENGEPVCCGKAQEEFRENMLIKK